MFLLASGVEGLEEGNGEPRACNLRMSSVFSWAFTRRLGREEFPRTKKLRDLSEHAEKVAGATWSREGAQGSDAGKAWPSFRRGNKDKAFGVQGAAMSTWENEATRAACANNVAQLFARVEGPVEVDCPGGPRPPSFGVEGLVQIQPCRLSVPSLPRRAGIACAHTTLPPPLPYPFVPSNQRSGRTSEPVAKPRSRQGRNQSSGSPLSQRCVASRDARPCGALPASRRCNNTSRARDRKISHVLGSPRVGDSTGGNLMPGFVEGWKGGVLGGTGGMGSVGGGLAFVALPVDDARRPVVIGSSRLGGCRLGISG
ncbi:hypothetical protein LZ30DRAFT_202671 [Colletotrichum cereale]|nr:hypothetical protein LZ30DRAFT_202671 [Colletotrichum cereale]